MIREIGIICGYVVIAVWLLMILCYAITWAVRRRAAARRRITLSDSAIFIPPNGAMHVRVTIAGGGGGGGVTDTVKIGQIVAVEPIQDER